MRLINGILRPGKVIEVLENGKIKASVPGLFTEEDKDLNPPIMPFFEIFGAHANHFSTPILNDAVWILNLTDNPRQLYWFRKDQHITNNQPLFDESGIENVEILCNRSGANGWATLYFSDGSGWILRQDQSRLQIYPDGHIDLGMPDAHRTIIIDPEAIKLGGGTEHFAGYGDVIIKRLEEICDLLVQAATAAKTYPETMPLSPVFQKASQIKGTLQEIESPNVKLD
jgi:hypothetical protein